MFLQNSSRLVGPPLAQRRQNGAVVMIRSFFPAGLPCRKEKAGARRMQVIDGGKKTRHAAGRQNQAMETTVCFLPGVDITGSIAIACRLLGLVQNG